MPDILNLRDLSVTYPQAPGPAVEHVTLDISQGSITAIVGESGSGKSTILRSVIGLLSGGGRVTGGEMRFDGRDLTSLSEGQYRALRGRQISMIFQDAYSTMDPKKKVGYQYVESLRAHFDLTKSEAREQAREMLERIALPDPDRILSSYPFELSGGMIQRVAIAMSMSMRSKLLLADEPTSALDVTVQAQVVRAMMDLRDEHGTTILMVTHNLGVAAYMADALAVMYNGHLVDYGRTLEIIDHPRDEYTRRLIASVPDMEVAAF